MRKHSLFKSMVIILLLVLVLTYIIPARAGEISYLPFGDIVTNYIQSYYYFFDTAVFVLAVGAFYGVLNKVGAYKKLLDTIVAKVKPNGKIFVFAMVVIFALFAALTGIVNPLMIFIPFVVSIILLLGYDKLIAISSTVIATLVGFIGGVFVTFRDPNNYYGYTSTTFEKFVGIGDYANIIPKIVLLVLGVALLIWFINRHIKDVENKKVKYNLNNNSELLVTEVKGNYKDIKTWPLIVILSVLLVLLILGLVPWNDLFKIEVFTKFHTWISELSIKNFNIFGSIISSVFTAFGKWAELGSYMMTIVIMFIATAVIKLVYKVKLDDLMTDMAEGAKKLLPTAALMMLAFCILVCTYNNGFVETIISKVSTKGDINFVVASLVTMLGSLLHVDIYYTVAGVFSPILSAVTNEAMLNVFALLFQSIYGLMLIIGPTSILLIFALSYLDVPYTTWLKYIWRFVLSLFIIIFAMLLIIALI